MGDRVPISTIPGLVSAWVGETITVIPAGDAYDVRAVFLQRNGNGAGDVVECTLNTGASSTQIALTTGLDEVYDAGVAGQVTSAQTTTLTVDSADTNSENLRGWIEIEGATSVTSQLTSLARVKRFLGLTASTSDTLLNELIASVSKEIQDTFGIRFIESTATDEPVDSIGRHLIVLDHRPIISFTSLTENATALVEDTGYEATAQDKNAGLVARISGSTPIAWATGRRVVRVTYSHGYQSVPEAVQNFATKLAALDFYQAQPGRDALGLDSKVLQTGATASYSSRASLWDDHKQLVSVYSENVP